MGIIRRNKDASPDDYTDVEIAMEYCPKGDLRYAVNDFKSIIISLHFLDVGQSISQKRRRDKLEAKSDYGN